MVGCSSTQPVPSAQLLLEAHCRHLGPHWALSGTSAFGKQNKYCLNACLNTGHSLTCGHLLDILSPCLLTFPFSPPPIHFHSSFCSSLFSPPVHPFSYFLLCDDFIFSGTLSFVSTPSFSFQMYAKGYKGIPLHLFQLYTACLTLPQE